MKPIFSLSQLQTRIADCFNMAVSSGMTSEALHAYVEKYIYAETLRKHGTRAVYNNSVQGFVQGQIALHTDNLYRYNLEYCYMIEGVLYSTHKQTDKRSVEEIYTRDISLFDGATSGHYWKGTDKPYYINKSPR